MVLNSLQEIERAIDQLTPQQMDELYSWLDRHRPAPVKRSDATVYEHGLDLFGSAGDAALIDEVVHMASEERRRPTGPAITL